MEILSPRQENLASQNALACSTSIEIDSMDENDDQLELLATFSEHNYEILQEDQLEVHLRLCRKLYIQNKISVRNVWELHIIDIIKTITSNDSDDALRRAGEALDIGVRVYSCRVDDAHARVVRLANTMARRQAVESGQDAEQNQRRAIKVQKLAGAKKNTIETDRNNLFILLNSLPPVFSFGAEYIHDIDNLFTSKLVAQPGNHQLAFLSAERYWIPSTTETLINTNKSCNAILDFLPTDIADLGMCDALKDFEWNVMGAEAPASNEEPDSLINEEERQLEDDLKEEIDMPDIPEAPRVNVITGAGVEKFVDRIWAGPSLWKVCNKRPRVTQSVVRRKRPRPIDFSKKRKGTCKLKYLPRSAPRKCNSDKITLPVPETQELFEQQIRLLLKPSVSLHVDIDDVRSDPADTFEDHQTQLDLPDLQEQKITNILSAPKLDIKILKEALWQLLVGNSGKVQRTNFKRVYAELPKLLNEGMRNVLTCPLVLLVLLHLSNECNLELMQEQGSDDLIIQQIVLE